MPKTKNLLKNHNASGMFGNLHIFLFIEHCNTSACYMHVK